jgi:hypothetical protein
MNLRSAISVGALSEEELSLINDLNPAELAEAIRRLKAKSAAYLRSAQLIEAWKEGKANGRAN